METDQVLEICGKCYRLIRLLGHGKGGYSWLADCDGGPAVVKQIHHEPCDFIPSATRSGRSSMPMNA